MNLHDAIGLGAVPGNLGGGRGAGTTSELPPARYVRMGTPLPLSLSLSLNLSALCASTRAERWRRTRRIPKPTRTPPVTTKGETLKNEEGGGGKEEEHAQEGGRRSAAERSALERSGAPPHFGNGCRLRHLAKLKVDLGACLSVCGL